MATITATFSDSQWSVLWLRLVVQKDMCRMFHVCPELKYRKNVNDMKVHVRV